MGRRRRGGRRGAHRLAPDRHRAAGRTTWARLPSTDRVAVLAGVRAHDPAAARELVRSTWATDSARDRRAHLEALRIGLGPDDEPLLEDGLDDRAGTRA